MKGQVFSLVLISAFMMSCAGAGPVANEPNLSVNSVKNAELVVAENEWKLVAVYIDGEDTLFRRDNLPKEPGNLFTLTFGAEIISGVGAPNHYSAPYTRGDNQSISVMLMRSTMMAALFEPENLSEHDFFVYLQNAYSWKLVNNNLELSSKTQNGNEVRLVFSL